MFFFCHLKIDRIFKIIIKFVIDFYLFIYFCVKDTLKSTPRRMRGGICIVFLIFLPIEELINKILDYIGALRNMILSIFSEMEMIYFT
jgi:hypothetical protein